MKIDWQSTESYLILNPRLPASEAQQWQSVLSCALEKHIWLTTSGSTQTKLVALHKEAILTSAEAVNKHLGSSKNDIWVNSLPLFHIGGLSIQARGYLNGAQVINMDQKWSPHVFAEILLDSQATLTALVPTQLYDLVVHHIHPPSTLRAVIVGGGGLAKKLYTDARALGWPILPSYGLTECASQVATAPLQGLNEDSDPSLLILSHINIKTDNRNRISISSPSLLTASAYFHKNELNLTYPVIDGWYTTQDLGVLEGSFLKLLGREDDFIKIGGESVQLGRLEKILEEIRLELNLSFDIALCAIPDARLGHVIHLFTTDPCVESIQNLYNSRVLPFERFRQTHLVAEIPRSALKKLLKKELISRGLAANKST